jgi:hypothetical protein
LSPEIFKRERLRGRRRGIQRKKDSKTLAAAFSKARNLRVARLWPNDPIGASQMTHRAYVASPIQELPQKSRLASRFALYRLQPLCRLGVVKSTMRTRRAAVDYTPGVATLPRRCLYLGRLGEFDVATMTGDNSPEALDSCVITSSPDHVITSCAAPRAP